MPQSSLTAWLNKPAAVNPSPKEEAVENATPRKDTEEQLPTPPSSSQEVGLEEEGAVDTLVCVNGSANPPTQGLTARTPCLPPNVHIRKCTKEDIPAFKRLNSLLLPIPYSENFYRGILEDSVTSKLTLLATWHDNPSTIGKEKGRLVGAIRCRLLARPHGQEATRDQHSSAEKPMLYLSTLVLLSPYRSHGIATRLLQCLTVKAVEDYGIGSVGAHVWESNAEGLAWYRKRSFKEIGKEEGYYRRLKPQGAIVVRREVGVMDLLGG